MWGKVQKREERYQLIINDAEPVEQVKMILLELAAEQILDPRQNTNLESILKEQAAEKSDRKIPIVAIIKQGQQRQFIRLGQKYWVNNEEKAIARLMQFGFNARTELLVPA